MMIHANTAMRKVEVDGISVVVNSDDAKEFKRKFPNAKVTLLYPRKKKKVGHGKVVPVNVAHYLQSQGVN